jgi:hypothetical protein
MTTVFGGPAPRLPVDTMGFRFLDDMDGLTKHIGAKTAATWRLRIKDLRLRVTELLGDE